LPRPHAQPGSRLPREKSSKWASPTPGVGRAGQRYGQTDPADSLPHLISSVCKATDVVYECAPRGVGETRWTRKNPPNYVERSHVLLGRTVDTGRVWDIIATARYLRSKYDNKVPLHVLGEGPVAVLAAYAALWEPDIAGVIAVDPPTSHMDPNAPQFLNVLRVCDIPDVLGLLAPRPLTLIGGDADARAEVQAIYTAADAVTHFSHRPNRR